MPEVLLSLFSFCLAVNTASSQTAPNQRLPLPRPHAWESNGKHVCNAIGAVGISQAKDAPATDREFLVEAGRGARRLEITLGDKDVLVSVGGGETEKYKVVASRPGVLTALRVGDIEPTVNSITVDAVTSYVVWSATEPRDIMRDTPIHAAALLTCSPIEH